MSQLEKAVEDLYKEWISAWNNQDADGMGTLVTEDCTMVGFDGSEMQGQSEICKTLKDIFLHHPTARFVTGINEIREIAPGVALLRAHAGMVPRGQFDINPSVNAIQTLIATEKNGQWQIRVFQNTPAAFHGRPEAVAQMTERLRENIKMLPREQ